MAAAAKRRLSLSGRAAEEAGASEAPPTNHEEMGNIRASLKAQEKRIAHAENRIVEISKIGQDLIEASPWGPMDASHFWKCVQELTDSPLFEELEKEKIITNVIDHHYKKAFFRVYRSSSVRSLTQRLVAECNKRELPIFLTQYMPSNKILKKFARDYFHLLEECFQSHGIDVKNGITSLLPRAASA
eukprot:4302069-Karenia_brevis.AAC.1